jgi:hypothetical protein
MKRFRDPVKRAVLVFNTVLGFVPAVYFLVTGIFHSWLALSSPNWPSTMGEVFATIEHNSYTDVLYAYEAGGLQRESNQLSFSLFPQSPGTAPEYWEGQRVRVFYCPQFPSHSVLVPGWGWRPIVFIVVGGIFVPIGWLFHRGLGRTMQR